MTAPPVLAGPPLTCTSCGATVALHVHGAAFHCPSPSIDDCLAALASAGYDRIEAEVRLATSRGCGARWAFVLVWGVCERSKGRSFQGATLGEALQRAVKELAARDPHEGGVATSGLIRAAIARDRWKLASA